MLSVKNLHAYYGKSHIVQDVSFEIAPGEIVSLLGRNGVGRSTVLKAIMGEVDRKGSICFNDSEIGQLATHEIAKKGLGYVPENRDIFPTLTTRQNLILGEKKNTGKSKWSMEHLLRRFPNLNNRADVPAGVLSGGEQQMLTICRTLMGNPNLIMIDEPTEGLAPKIVEEVAALLKEIATQGLAILLVEQKLSIALDISDRVLVLGHGSLVFEGTPSELRSNPEIRQEWLEV